MMSDKLEDIPKYFICDGVIHKSSPHNECKCSGDSTKWVFTNEIQGIQCVTCFQETMSNGDPNIAHERT